MASCTTIHFKGDKNVEGLDTGHRKSRFTVVLCVSLSGRVIKTQIIFKNLKKAPKIANLPPGVLVSASKGGSMNTPLIEEWLLGCFSCRGPYFAKTPFLLMMDQYGSHVRKEVVDMIKKQYSTKILLVPKKCSYFSQPLDVAVNSAFKAALRREWEAWFQHGKKEYTQKGYRRRPPYQATVDMVSNAVDAMKSDSIQKAFCCCGVAANGEKVSYNELNSRLQPVIALAEEATGIVQQGDQNPFQGLEDEDDDEEFSDN